MKKTLSGMIKKSAHAMTHAEFHTLHTGAAGASLRVKLPHGYKKLMTELKESRAEEQFEEEARKSTVCLGCLGSKAGGQLVCWNCFKYRTDITPLKYFLGSLKEWLESISL